MAVHLFRPWTDNIGKTYSRELYETNTDEQ